MADYIPGPGEGTAVKPRVKPKPKTRPPRKHRVLLHNDDYTTMEFVVEILIGVFNKSADEAVQIMLDVHRKGLGVCGVYTAEVAKTKVRAVHDRARSEGYPLQCSMEPE